MKNQFVINLIRSYQKNKQVIGVGHCKFYPTCSQYALETYQKFNFFYATLLVVIRIIRCNPIARRRPYPVKLTKKEKEDILFVNTLRKEMNNDFVDYIQSINKLDNITPNELYNYIYDYYYLPIHPTASHTSPIDQVYGTRYLITSKITKVNYKNNIDLSFDEYLNVTKKLFDRGLIKFLPVKGNITTNNLNLIPLDAISLQDIINDQIEANIIVVNNYEDVFEMDGFKSIVINSSKQFKNLVKNYQKAIFFTKDFDIFQHLHDIDYSINLFESADQINYFYNINKKKL